MHSNNTLEKWEEKTIDEIAYIKGGKRLPKGEKLTTEKNSHPYIRVTDFNDFGTIDVDNVQFITDNIYEQIKNYTITSKDLYISIAGTIGKSGIIPKELDGANLTENACKLVYKSNEIFNKYVYYYTQTRLFAEQIFDKTKMAAMPKLALTRLATVKLPIPPLIEQKRIVGVLDEAFENIEKAKQNTLQNLNNAKELFESNLNFLFNSDNKWNKVKLEEIADITSSKRIYKSEYVKNGIPFYRTKEIKELAHNLPISIELYISEEKFNEIENKFGIPKENDLLISAVGTIGEIYVVKKNDKFYFKDGNLIWFRNIKEIVNTKFLKYILRAYVKTIQNMTNGAAYNALTIEKLKIYYINLPPLEEQQKIVQQLDELQEQTKKLEQIYTQKLQDLDELKQSILQKAFNGEL